MKAILIVFCFISCATIAQDNDISMDSLKTYLSGTWDANRHICSRSDRDSTELLVKFSDNHFFAREIYRDSVIATWEGDFTIDSINTAGYRVLIRLSPETQFKFVNSLILYMQIFKGRGILVSWLEAYYVKDEQKRCSPQHTYNFYKRDD